MIKSLLILIATLLLSLQLEAQKFRSYLHFTTKDGLPGDNVYAVIQDGEGFIWVATESGLSRFDGRTFKNFTVADGLPGNEIISLCMDSKGRLWIAPFNSGICFYQRGKIYNKSNSPLIRQFPPLSELKSLAEDADGRLLLKSLNNYTLISRDGQCTVLPIPLDRPGFFRPLWGFNSMPKEIIAHDILLNENLSNQFYSCNFFNVHPNFHYLFAESGHDIVVQHPDGRITRLPVPVSTLSKYPINDSLFIFNTTDGARIYALASGHLLAHLLPGFYVDHTFIDAEGGIWLGTSGAGLFYFPSGVATSVLLTPANTPLQVRNFYPSGHRLFAATSGGIFWELDKRTHLLNSAISTSMVPQEVLSPPAGNIIKAPAREFFTMPELRGIVPDAKSLVAQGHPL